MPVKIEKGSQKVEVRPTKTEKGDHEHADMSLGSLALAVH